MVFEWFLAVVQLEGFTCPGNARLQAGYSPKNSREIVAMWVYCIMGVGGLRTVIACIRG